MNKRCAICKQLKLTQEFARTDNSLDGRSGICSDCTAKLKVETGGVIASIKKLFRKK